jgi:radical SAM protein with 4Fe4S-binding SPASM domain
MRLPFEKTVKNILSLLEWNKKSSGHVKRIVLSRVMESNSSDRQFLKECEKLFSPFIPGKEYYLFLKAKSNWLGAVDCSASPVPYPFPCAGWFDINILCNGVVPHCCQDVEGKYSLGNVLESSLLDIYNGPFRKLRDTSTTREDITPCNQCSILQ